MKIFRKVFLTNKNNKITEQDAFRIEKVLKTKGDRTFVKRKGYDFLDQTDII